MASSGGSIEIRGDGRQTRSLCYIDDFIEGLHRVMESGHADPLNLGSDEMVTINGVAKIIIDVSGKRDVTIKHIDGPQGVRGCNSDNTLMREVLGWETRERP